MEMTKTKKLVWDLVSHENKSAYSYYGYSLPEVFLQEIVAEAYTLLLEAETLLEATVICRTTFFNKMKGVAN